MSMNHCIKFQVQLLHDSHNITLSPFSDTRQNGRTHGETENPSCRSHLKHESSTNSPHFHCHMLPLLPVKLLQLPHMSVILPQMPASAADP